MPSANRRCALHALLLALPALCAGISWAEDGYIPSDDSLIVEALPQGRATPPSTRGGSAVPATLAAAVAEAYRLIGAAQRSGDVRFYGFAQAQLAPWWDQERPPNAVLLLRAMIRQALHDFPTALTDLDLLLRQTPESAQAWLSRAMILLVQGRPEAAVKSCGRLIGRVDDLIGAACIAAAAPSAQTLGLLNATLDQPPSVSPAVLVWARCVQAEAAERLGLDALAVTAFREAMALDPADPGLLARYSAFLLRERQAAAVVDLLEGQVQSTTLLLHLAQAARLTAHPDATAYGKRLQAYFAAEALRGETLHLREAARAQLELFDAPQRALQLATANWSNQRELADARLLLEAAVRANRPQAAAPVLQWLKDHRVADVRLAELTRALEAARHASL